MQDAEDSPLAAQRLDELKAVLADSPLADNKPFLRACLRAKKYQVEKAHTLAVNYEEFGPRVGWVAPAKPVTAVSLEAELRSGFNLILPEPDLHGHVVVTQRMGLLDFKNGSSLESHQRAGYYLLHRALQREQAQRFGVALVLDFRGFGFRLFTRVGAGDLSRGIAMLQDCFPARLAVIYILHQPIWLSALVAMLGPLVNKDSLKQKFVLLGDDYAQLHEHIPAERLPKALEAGGTLELDWGAVCDRWVAEERERDWVDLASFFKNTGSKPLPPAFDTTKERGKMDRISSGDAVW